MGKSSGRNRGYKCVQECRIDVVVTAVSGKIRRLDFVVRLRMHQTLDRSIGRCVMNEDRRLRASTGRNRFDRRIILIVRVAILELDHGIRPVKVLRWGA